MMRIVVFLCILTTYGYTSSSIDTATADYLSNASALQSEGHLGLNSSNAIETTPVDLSLHYSDNYTSIPLDNSTESQPDTSEAAITANTSTQTVPVPLTVASPANDTLETAAKLAYKVIKNYSISSGIPKGLVAVTFVNGIYHSELEWQELANDISEIFGTEVYPFYYPSTGNWAKDASMASYARFVRPSDHPQVLALVNHLRSVLALLSPKGRILHLAHSGGAILTYLAAKHHLSKEEKDRIDVITFGGGRSITRKYFGGYIVNYYATNDLVSMIDGRAAGLKNKKIMRNDTYVEIRDEKHNTSFVFLRALANNVLLDHSMNGPTYRIALRREAKALRARIDLILRQEAREKDRIRLARKVVANYTGLHRFWSDPFHSVRHMIAKAALKNESMSPYEAVLLNMNSLMQQVSSTGSHSIRYVLKSAANMTGIHHFWNSSFAGLVDGIDSLSVQKPERAIIARASDDSPTKGTRYFWSKWFPQNKSDNMHETTSEADDSDDQMPELLESIEASLFAT
jgi:hypothetical protein